MTHYPLVCDPTVLAGAEERARAFPHLGYDWAIQYAAVPLPRRRRSTRRATDTSAALEYLQHRRRSMTARRAK